MGKNIFLIFTFLHFCIATSVAQDEFPWKGGTTSDGIVISKPNMDGFKKMEKVNSLQVEKDADDATLTFNVTVPQGKTASLQYKLLLKLFAKKSGAKPSGNSDITYIARVDKKQVKLHHDPSHICYQGEEISIPSGKHKITLSATFKGSNCNTAGSLDSVYIHVHDFSKVEISREPLCGIPGEGYSNCEICGKDSIVKVAPQYDKHLMTVTKVNKTSCFSSADSVSECEHCPYWEIRHTGKRNEHDFDADGTCRVCHLHIPACSADSSVYTINDAGEMRILAEMVSLGRIPGNIGIDLKSDMVFGKDMVMLPLGTFDHPFQGVLNGNGHRILGIVNAFQGVDCLGFVGVAKGTITSHAVIANLIFDSGNTMRGEACVGGLVGYATDCDIVNCASFGSLEGTDNVGGIVGYADQHVSIQNCASVTAIRTKGNWNTMVCGMPMGHILNSYGAATNNRGGIFDELPTTTLRHCFSSQGSAEGLTQVSQDMMSSYQMVQLLNEESESPCFMMSQEYHYPIPVVNSTVLAKANAAIHTPRGATWRRAASSTLSDDDDDNEKDNEVEVKSGYVDETAPPAVGRTVEEVINDDATEYPDLERMYIVTRSVPEGFQVYDEICGGDLLDFESYILPADSSYIRMTEFTVLSPDEVKAKTEMVCYYDGDKEQIDQYSIDNSGSASLKARITFENVLNVVYQECIDGILVPVWSVETEYDESGNAKVSNAYSFDPKTGETSLEYSSTYDSEDDDTEEDDGEHQSSDYMEYVDEVTNTIHIIYTYPSDSLILREHYILRASDQYPLECLMENIVDGVAYLVDGFYFLYDDYGELKQSVAFGPVDEDLILSDIRPYLYHEYIGFWQGNAFPTAIKVPTMEQPSLQKQMDTNVYDMQGRVVRKVTDMKDPFSGLPRGIYIYQGSKYLKR